LRSAKAQLLQGWSGRAINIGHFWRIAINQTFCLCLLMLTISNGSGQGVASRIIRLQ
jgi:hypothetical protein